MVVVLLQTSRIMELEINGILEGQNTGRESVVTCEALWAVILLSVFGKWQRISGCLGSNNM
jgi:hypothetical protein